MDASMRAARIAGIEQAARLVAMKIDATDAWTFASVASIFIATSLAACSIPAIRAARIEASLALRAE